MLHEDDTHTRTKRGGHPSFPFVSPFILAAHPTPRRRAMSVTASLNIHNGDDLGEEEGHGYTEG